MIIFEIIPRDKLVQKIFEYQKKFNPMISIYKKEISTIENKINNITRAVEDGAPYKLFSFKIIELENRKSELEVELNKAIIDNETLEIELINSNFKKYLDIDFNNKMEKSFIINSLVDSIALSHNGEITISIKYSQRKIKSINQDSEIIKNIENKSNKLLSNWKLVPGLIIFVTSINEYKSKIENRRIRRNKY